MLILENLLGLKSKQADVTEEFFHATLREDKKVYKEFPLNFKQHDSDAIHKVWYLKKTLYGLCQCAFWKYLTEQFGNCGLPQAPFDPCLFLVNRSLPIVKSMIVGISWSQYLN